MRMGVLMALMSIGLPGVRAIGAGQAAEASVLPSVVVAVVEGKVIDTSRVKPADRWAMENTFFRYRRRAPSGPQDEVQLLRLEESRRCGMVREAIILAVQSRLLAQANITVSDEDRVEWRQRRPRRDNPEKDAEEMRATGAALKEALDAVYLRKEDPKAVYERMRPRLVYSEAAWNFDVYAARDPERRKEVVGRLSEQLPALLVDYYSRPDSADGAIRLEKFRRQIYMDPSSKEFRTPSGVLLSDDVGAVYGRWLLAQVAKSHVWLDSPVWAERCVWAKRGIVVSPERR